MSEPGTELSEQAAARHWPRRPWLGPHRPFLRRLAQPVVEFIYIEAAGGAVLLVAALVALLWVNSPWRGAYDGLWSTQLGFELGRFEFRHDLHDWVNDGLMVLFFFVVGLELKDQFANGQLQDLRRAAVPMAAAAGGMLIPAAVYLAMNAAGGEVQGWGIPVATDIAFAFGVVALLGSRISAELKAFLLALAMADDVGAILVIALFYASDISAVWLAVAGGLLAMVVLMRWLKVWYVPAYAVVGLALWFATFQSGVHATIAGVALGLITPARPLLSRAHADRLADEQLEEKEDVEEARDVAFLIRESVPLAQRLQRELHPWTSYLVIPLFALANAGLHMDGELLREAATSPVTLGVAVALVVGKPVGILAASWTTVRLGLGSLASGLSWPQVLGIGAVAGIGFTMSLFIAALAFSEGSPEYREAQTGILAGSLIAATAGLVLLGRATAGEQSDESPQQED